MQAHKYMKKLARRLYPQATEFERRLSVYVHAGMTIPVLFPVCAKRAVPRTYGHISSFHLFPLSFSRSTVPHFPMFHLLVCPSSHFPTFPFPHKLCGTKLGVACGATGRVAPHWGPQTHVVPQAVWHHIGRPMWCHRPCGTTLGTPAPCGATSPMGSPDGPYVVTHGRRNAQTPHLRIKNQKVTTNIENTCYFVGL